jgi:raffinose/stachyose/melibiose transport system permease protein
LFADQSNYPVTSGLFTFYGQYVNEWTLLAAATLIVATLLIVLYLFLQRYFSGGTFAETVKAT